MSTVDRIRAKVARANQHIKAFQLGLSAFCERKPYGLGIKEDMQTRKRVYCVTKVDPVPSALEAIAADVIQNLRSPLDHIADQVVFEANDGVYPPRKVYYQIISSATEPFYNTFIRTWPSCAS